MKLISFTTSYNYQKIKIIQRFTNHFLSIISYLKSTNKALRVAGGGSMAIH